MSVDEATLAFQFIYATLSADSQLTGYAPGGIWRGYAPPETVMPFVIFSLQSATDVVTINASRVMVDGLFQVKCIGPSSTTAAVSNGASCIDALLGKPPVSGTVIGGYIASSYRQSIISLDEIINGELRLTMGGLYRFIIEQTS